MSGDWGGKRAGAGRKPGVGARPLSIRSEARAKIAQIVGGRADPLEFVCALANDPEQDVRLRLEAALGVLPYIHPRLSAMASVSTTMPKGTDPKALLETMLGRIERLKPAPIIEAETAAVEAPE